MTKYLIRIETSIGYENYRLILESTNRVQSTSSGNYYISDVLISSVTIFQSNSSRSDGPFINGKFYDKLIFPIQGTLVSQQAFEFGDTNEVKE